MDGDEIEDEGLTILDAGGNTDAVETEASAEVETPGDEDKVTEDGPSQEGELSDKETEDGEPGSSEPEETPAAPKAPESIGADEVTRLRQEIETARAERLVMLDLLQQRQQRPVAPPLPGPREDVPREAVRMAMLGSTEEAWRAYPQEVRERAFKIARDHLDREIERAINPQDVQGEVERKVLERVQPILEDFHSRRAREVRERHLTPLKDPAVEKRARELFPSMPGSQSTDWRDIEKAVQAAAAQARLEAHDRKLREQENKVKAAQVQKGVNGGSKLKASGTSGNASKTSKEPPPMKPGERLSDYAERLKAYLS